MDADLRLECAGRTVRVKSSGTRVHVDVPLGLWGSLRLALTSNFLRATDSFLRATGSHAQVRVWSIPVLSLGHGARGILRRFLGLDR